MNIDITPAGVIVHHFRPSSMSRDQKQDTFLQFYRQMSGWYCSSRSDDRDDKETLFFQLVFCGENVL